MAYTVYRPCLGLANIQIDRISFVVDTIAKNAKVVWTST